MYFGRTTNYASTLALLVDLTAAPGQQVTTRVREHYLFIYTTKSIVIFQQFSCTTNLLSYFIPTMEPSKEKNPELLVTAKSLANIPWCEQYERMISGMLLVLGNHSYRDGVPGLPIDIF